MYHWAYGMYRWYEINTSFFNIPKISLMQACTDWNTLLLLTSLSSSNTRRTISTKGRTKIVINFQCWYNMFYTVRNFNSLFGFRNSKQRPKTIWSLDSQVHIPKSTSSTYLPNHIWDHFDLDLPVKLSDELLDQFSDIFLPYVLYHDSLLMI